MIARVKETISRYDMFRPGQAVGVAVSGGADSVCLLHVLRELAPAWNLRLSVLHLDHGLRGEESRGDAEFVRELAAGFGYRLHLESAVLGEDNLEQSAREARYAFFGRFLASGALDRVAVGHTRSDQAETVLFRFLRGSGTAGLAGIRPVTAQGIVRPLIGVTRQEVLEFLHARHLGWREDSTNAAPQFARNRIRHSLLPALARDWNPAIAETLARTSECALDEEAWWAAEIDRIAPRLLNLHGRSVLVPVQSLVGLHPAVARRVVRRAVELAKGSLRGIDFAHIQGILGLAADPAGSGRAQAAGLDIYRSFDWLRITPLPLDMPANRNFRTPLTVPGEVVLRNGAVLRTEVVPHVYNGGVGCLDWERISGSLEVRNWRPGDQYQPSGHSRAEKIKQLFQEARVPLWERRDWPVVVRGETILWARRFGPDVAYAAGPGTRLALRIHDFEESISPHPASKPIDTGLL